MEKRQFTVIAAGSIESGPTPFDIYTRDKDGRMILYLRQGLGFTEDRKEILRTLGRTFYIAIEDQEAYLDYASERLDRIVSNPEIRISDKAGIVYGVGKLTVKRLMDDPRSGRHIKKSRCFVESQVSLIFSSPEAAANMFAISAYDSYTFSHSINVCTFCIMLGELLYGKKEELVRELGLAGLLHDIGKSRIDPHLLDKPKDLTPGEWEEMRRHTIYSYEIIREHSLPEAVLASGRSHHERLDGSGYPDGLLGNEIHSTAKIVAVADIYDALTSDRAYRASITPVEALNDMASYEGQIDDRAFKALALCVLRSDELVARFRKTKRIGPFPHLVEADGSTLERMVR